MNADLNRYKFQIRVYHFKSAEPVSTASGSDRVNDQLDASCPLPDPVAPARGADLLFLPT
jgi:hypothetical protein